jgi:phosphoglycolate phosphatase
MAPRPRGIIFDLDGTLLDTLTDITNATNVALATAGLRPCSPDQVRRYVGSGVHVLVRRASGVDDPQRVEDMVRTLRDHYGRHALDNTRLYPGVAEMLDRLAAAGMPMCIFSNKPHAYTVLTVEGLLSAWSFVEVLGESPDNPRKPDPVVVWRLVDRMGLSRDEVVLVGDSEVDAETGRNAGMTCIGITWGFRDRSDLRRAGADPIIDHPRELPPLLGLKDVP